MYIDNSYNSAKDKLNELFASNTPVVLYISAECTELPSIVLDQPWSCIFTSSKSTSIAYSFLIDGKRSIKVFTQYEEMLSELVLSKKNLPIVFINGTEANDNASLSFREKQIRQAETKKTLHYVADMLHSNYGQMVIINYSPDKQGEVQINDFYEAFSSMRKGSLLLFDTANLHENSNSREYINDLIEHGQLFHYSSDLVSALCQINSDSAFEQDIYSDPLKPEADSGIIQFYIEKKLVHLPAKTMLEIQGFVQMLSREEIPDISINDASREDYFYQFLKSSSSRPIWYGYQHGFYLKRKYFEQLISTVKKDLANKESRSQRQSIILIGQNSSSKSIMLSALAYEIYQEREYPVLFIRNPDINLDINSSNYRALDLFLQALEENGARRTLIIWDNSSSTSQVMDTKKLNTVFVNRGRKVTLVTSAYEQPQDFYRHINADQKGFISVPDFKIIKSSIDLRDEESIELRRIVITNTSIAESQYDSWSMKNDRKNLLTMLYTLLYSHIHAEIASGFQKEVLWGTSNLILQLEKAYNNKNQYLSVMATAFIKAGFDLSEIVQEDDTIKKDSIGDKLVQLCNIVATSYQRKVRLPLSLLLRVIGLDLDDRYVDFQKAMFDIPFLTIEAPENDDSRYDYVVSFRTQLEAELYLQNQGIKAEEQIKNICELIVNASFANAYERHSELSVIEQLIKTIGPNIDIAGFKEKNKKFKPYYDKVIEAMKKLRLQVFEPRLACQEVVWLREVYGVKETDAFDPDIKIEKLRDAQRLARQTLQVLTHASSKFVDNSSRITRNNLTVESALIERRLYRIQSNEQQASGYLVTSFDYMELSNLLQNVIASDPNNTFPYNALLGLFIDYYAGETDIERRTNRLSEILSVIEDVDSTQRDVVDNEEYQEHKQKILLLENSEKYQQYYDELIVKGSASGVHLKARNMLQEVGINNYRQGLESSEEQQVAREAIRLLRDKWSVTSSHSGCQTILLNLTWLLYNKQPIFHEERQFTKMSNEQWKELYDICKNFEQQFLKSAQKPFNGPTVYYLLALASAQLENYGESFDAFKSIDESMFFKQVRNKVWHIICDHNGVPKKFNGRIDKKNYHQDSRSGYVIIEDISRSKGIHFYEYNLHLPDILVAKSDFEIGTNYIGFSAFRELEKSKGGKSND